MAYGKRYRSRKTTRYSYKRRAPPLRRNTYKAVKRIVSKTIAKNSELKYKDTLIDEAAIDSDGVATCINVVPRGSANTSRVGERIKTKFLKITGRIWMPPVNDTEISNSYTTLVRMMVVYWRNLKGSTSFLTAELLQYAGSPQATCSPLNYNTNRQWEVLYDKKMTLASTPTAVTLDNTIIPAGFGFANKKYFDIRIPLKKTIQYNSAEQGEGIEDNPADGTLFFFVVSDVTGEGYGPEVDCFSRLYYYDD